MNNSLRRDILLVSLILLLALLPVSLRAQTAKATSVFGFPGAGVLQAGDLWESFLPENSDNGYYSESPAVVSTFGRRTFIRMGNYDRQWSTPNSSYPNSYFWQNYWEKEMAVYVYDRDTTFNPASIGGAANPSFFVGDKPLPQSTYENYAQLSYKTTVVGAKDSTRNYTIEPYFTDSRRQHVVYEAAWPTNVGIDVKFRAHGFAAPNWGNLNDFVLIEITLKNTGVVDMNMDGTAEKTNHVIQAFDYWMGAQSYMSITNYKTGGRAGGTTQTPIGRQTAYIGDPDPQGFPWDFVTVFPSATTYNPAPGSGKTDLGFNHGPSKEYSDLWYGWTMLDVKQGSMPADVTTTVNSLTSKNTIFNTHPIGTGVQRGWYAGGSAAKLAWGLSSPRDYFNVCAAQWFKDGGKTVQNARANLDLNYNPNFFASGTKEDILSFVPLAQPGRPDGDYKLTGTFDQVSFEDGTGYPAGYGKFSIGASHTENFDGEMYQSVGPFALNVGESVTIVLATVAGYRLEGIQRAVEAARWAFSQNLQVPQTPSLPKVLTKPTPNKSITIEWDKAAETDANFAGYKIWKSSQVKKKSFLDQGMRIIDKYQEQSDPGPIPDALKKPVNPKFDAFAAINATSLKGIYQPDTWGTWDLLTVIPKSALTGFTAVTNPGTSTTTGYAYKYEDKETILGFTYWYYVSAFKDVPSGIAGPGGQTTTRIETHSTNRNGASGLWLNTYPFAFANANFPPVTNVAAYQAIGGSQTVVSAVAANLSVATVGVRPNPYKRAALHDNRSQVYDHKLMFYNLPAQAKITIIDVAGQIIDVINFTSSNGVGSVFWDMFSKDGIEVSSGLYIYVVESSVGKQIGHFAILR
jgi:hypothetical protein